MSIFQCENCGCAENTVYGEAFYDPKWFDWTGIEERKGLKLCSACSPTSFSEGTPTKWKGKWHNQYPRIFLEKGMWKTNGVGNLEHIDLHVTNYWDFALNKEVTEYNYSGHSLIDDGETK
jgi:hypothetical protein